MYSRLPPPQFVTGRPWIALIIWGLAWGFAAHLFAQEAPPAAQATSALTAETIESRLAEVDASDLDDAGKASVNELYQDARAKLDTAQEAIESRATYQAIIDGAAAAVGAAQRDLERPIDTAPKLPPDASIDNLQQLLREAEQQATAAKDEVTGLNAEPSRRQTRLREIPEQLSAAREALKQVEQQLATAPPAGESPLATAARKAQQRSSQMALQAQVASWEKEQAAYAATTELLALQRDVAARQVSASETRREALAERVAQLRQAESSERLNAAQRDAAQTLPAVRPLALANQQLAEEAQQLSDQLKKDDDALKKTQRLLDEISQQYERTQEKVESVGLTDALGILLRSDRDQLAKSRATYEASRGRGTQIRDAQLRLLELEDQRAALADPESQLTAIRQETSPGQWTPEVESSALRLLESQRSTLDTLIANQRLRFETLVAADSAEHELVEIIDDYTKFIEGRILWVRSAPPLRTSDAGNAARALAWMLQPQAWLEVGRAMRQGLRQHSLLYAVLTMGFLFLLIQQTRLRRRLHQLGDQAQRATCQNLSPTIEAAVATLAIAALWPAFLCCLGWRISRDASSVPLGLPLGQGLTSAGLYLLLVELLRQVARPHGLGPAHLAWGELTATTLRRHMRWLGLVSVLVFLAVFFQVQADETHRHSLGRISFLILMLCVAAAFHSWMRPQGLVVQTILRRNPESAIRRYRLPCAALLIGLPLSLVLLAVSGYYFTAHRLAGCLLESMYLLVLILLLRDLLLRSILINRRRIAFQQRAQRVAEAASIQQAEAAEIPLEPEPQVDLSAISEQTSQLTRVLLILIGVLGAGLVWIDFLPALERLNMLVLWRVSVAERVEDVTILHLLISLTTLFVTVVAVKNLPGLLELVFLKRLPLDAGARYAVTTISRYVIAVLGFVVGLGVIRVQWAKYSWLVAAATVGLGFGLQEIFANFVSGLIVLLERPIRIGDVVTVDQTTGVVSRIHMRATVVTNWDRQELVVPNKEFVTGKLLNWTLSNSTSRIVLEIGVAYGSDTRLTRELLTDIVSEHPRVMKDPAPMVTFEALGESTLNFVVRAFVPTLNDRLPTIQDLNESIHDRFAAAGIEIAFPQRDLHLRTWPQQVGPQQVGPQQVGPQQVGPQQIAPQQIAPQQIGPQQVGPQRSCPTPPS